MKVLNSKILWFLIKEFHCLLRQLIALNPDTHFIKISIPIQFIPTLSKVCHVKKHSCQHAILGKGRHP